jgi:hypothetical protein
MRHGLIRTAVLAGAATLLAGCGVVPPVIAALSYAIDGVSLIGSGKSVSDHALSAATERDCALFRVFTTGEICRDYALTASTLPLDLSPAPAAAGHAGRDGAETPSAVAVAVVPRPVPAETRPAATARLSYLVLASFREARPAEQLAAAHGAIGASVKEAEVDGKHWYRVVAGPARMGELAALQASLTGVGLERPWILNAPVEAPRFETLALALTPVL